MREVKADVRSASCDDALDIARIYVDSWNAAFAELMPTREISAELVERWHDELAKSPPHRWWVVDVNGNASGFAGIGPSREPVDAAIGELDTIAVDPPRWRTGLGRSLMTVVLEHLVEDGYESAVLWTPGEYEQGRRFYEAMEWAADGGVRAGGRQVRYRHGLGHRTHLDFVSND